MTDLETAKRILEETRRARAEECTKEIQAVLEKHVCIMDVSMVLKAGQGPQVMLNILPKD